MFILVVGNSRGSKHVEFLHFLIILKLMASKESLKFLTPKLPITLQISQV